MSRVVSVRFNENEINALNNIADTHGVGLSTMIKTLALEKLSDEYDIQVVKEYVLKNNGLQIKIRKESYKTNPKTR